MIIKNKGELSHSPFNLLTLFIKVIGALNVFYTLLLN